MKYEYVTCHGLIVSVPGVHYCAHITDYPYLSLMYIIVHISRTNRICPWCTLLCAYHRLIVSVPGVHYCAHITDYPYLSLMYIIVRQGWVIRTFETSHTD